MKLKNKKINEIENVVLDEVKKELNWKEKIIMHVFTRYTYKVYNIARVMTMNRFLK